MRKASELFEYNKKNDYGKSMNDKTTYNLFQYCARQLEDDEVGKMSFVGILYYQPSAQFVQWYGVVITNRRLIVGLAGFFGREHVTFNLSEFEGLSKSDGALYSTITFLHPKKNINIGVQRHKLDEIFEDVLANTDLQDMSK